MADATRCPHAAQHAHRLTTTLADGLAQVCLGWTLCVSLVLGLVVGGILSWAGAASAERPRADTHRLVACVAPLAAALQVPCPQPDPGGPSTTLLGACPANSPTQWASCMALASFASTWAFYLVVLWGLLCALWWLTSVVRLMSPVGTVRASEALSLVLRNGFVAVFAFLVAWSLQALYAQVEVLLLAAQHEPNVLPLQIIGYLALVVLALLIRIGAGVWLLNLLLSLLKGSIALAGHNPRALAGGVERLYLMGGLLFLLLAAPALLSLAAQLIMGETF